jgi:hypothetical protein
MTCQVSWMLPAPPAEENWNVNVWLGPVPLLGDTQSAEGTALGVTIACVWAHSYSWTYSSQSTPHGVGVPKQTSHTTPPVTVYVVACMV